MIKQRVADLQNLLKEKNITLKTTDDAKEFLAQRGFNPIYGARPLKRFLQSHVETMLGRKIIADEIAPDSTVVLDSDGEELLFR